MKRSARKADDDLAAEVRRRAEQLGFQIGISYREGDRPLLTLSPDAVDSLLTAYVEREATMPEPELGPYGPYDTEADTYAAPMVAEQRRLHREGRIASGDPDRIARGAALSHLFATCEGAGVDLGAFDRRTLVWLADCQIPSIQVIIGLISRAHAAGMTEARAAHIPGRPPWQQLPTSAEDAQDG